MGVDEKEEGEAEKKLIEQSTAEWLAGIEGRATMGATQQWNLGSKDAKEDSWGPNSVDNDDGWMEFWGLSEKIRAVDGAGEASDLPMRGMDVADGGHHTLRMEVMEEDKALYEPFEKLIFSVFELWGNSKRKGVKDKDRIRTIKGLKDKEGKIKDKDRIRITKGLKDKERKIKE
ncbi:hypothetical protein PPACK8108_LOCUS9659 [Phakopsora pachyrhizi]|uniref:Uncharacterized protein n=1 Tax=Phakopsora pachyrhizi TaxID=170000 RepID=A0AAV0AZK4_PHAPC|nr:hypothetical protein PPACK8108_LOCUS9659 [Phakopsora pachyrhizi]